MADELDAMFPTEHQVAEPDKVETVVEPQEPVAEAPPPEPEPPAPEVEPIVPDEPKRDSIPIAALMDERDKRKALEAELRQIRDAQARAEPQQAPDPLDDPQGFQAWQQNELGRALFQERFNTSEYLATEKYGEETVQAAADWAEAKAKADPTFIQRYTSERFPVMWIVQQHQRDALLTDIGDPSKLDDWFAREASKRGYVAQSAAPSAAAPVVAPTQPAPKAPTPPRSIASDASPARVAPDNGSFNVFDGLLTR